LLSTGWFQEQIRE